METIVKWRCCGCCPLHAETLRKDNPKKSLVNGNPLYKETPHTGQWFIQGDPLVNKRGIHLQREINYTRKPLIYGKPCKANALSNKGAHPRPSFFGESNVHLKISKTIEKHKKENIQKNTFRPMSAKWTWVWKLCCVLFGLLVFSVVLDSFCLDLFGCFGSFGFPGGFWRKLLPCMLKCAWKQLNKHAYGIR